MAAESEAVQPRRTAQRPWWKRRAATILVAATFSAILTILLAVNLTGRYAGFNESPFQRGPRVNLGYATYIGRKRAGNVDEFLGMRYASPPTGNLRWRAPVEPQNDSITRSAVEFKPICFGTYAPYPAGGQDEDCLYANVWAPSRATKDSKLPVWVFIQGGGYTANSNANWNGAEVVETSGHNIVFVNFNYRVGLWGFLASDKVRQDGDLNVGLLDQRMLLKWVKEHIAKFGGDPDHVVIHGASAGAGSVALHMVAYNGRNDNLFVGAVAESVFFPSQPYVSDLEWQFDRLAAALDCAQASNPLSCLRAKPISALQAANVGSPFPNRTSPGLFYWTPCIDGTFLTDLPYTLYARGAFLRLPVMYGTDSDEGSTFAANAATAADMARFLADNYPRLTPNDTAAIAELYPPLDRVPHHAAMFPSASQAYGEATFTCPCVNILDAMSASAEDRAWGYRYNVFDEGNAAAGVGVPHLFEAAAIFGPDNINGAPGSYYSYNRGVVPVVMGYWISFVRALDPNRYKRGEAVVWERWGGEERRRLVFETGNSRMEETEGKQVERCRFWMGLKDVMQQ